MAVLQSQVRKRVFLRDLVLKMIVLPRQPRDKHRESTQKETRCVFLQDPTLGLLTIDTPTSNR